MNCRYRTRSRIAGGLALIALVFLLETFIADRIAPNPASPYVWTVLIAVVVGALAAAAWYTAKARADEHDDR